MRKIKILVAISASLVLAAGLSSAYVLFNPPGKWLSNDLPRNIDINQNGHSAVNDGDGGVSAIVSSLASGPASWNGAVPGSITTTSTGSPPASVGDGISTMHFNVVGTGCSGGCLAVTFTPVAQVGSEVVNGTSFGGFTDSDIFFNPKAKFYSSGEADGCRREFHIETVAVHEVGHLLGLDHTPVSSAVMYAFSDYCNDLTLHQDDIDGINCIYNNGYGCGACVPDTLIVDQTNCDQPSSGANAGDFVVETFIVDNCGSPVAGADVTIDVPTSPDGPLSCSGTTSSTGRLGCALDNPTDGLYETLVGSVAAAGYSSWTGSECGGVGQPPCGCAIEIGGGGCVPTSNKEKGPKCSDGLDNDCDGFIDGADSDC